MLCAAHVHRQRFCLERKHGYHTHSRPVRGHRSCEARNARGIGTRTRAVQRAKQLERSGATRPLCALARNFVQRWESTGPLPAHSLLESAVRDAKRSVSHKLQLEATHLNGRPKFRVFNTQAGNLRGEHDRLHLRLQICTTCGVEQAAASERKQGARVFKRAAPFVSLKIQYNTIQNILVTQVKIAGTTNATHNR